MKILNDDYTDRSGQASEAVSAIKSLISDLRSVNGSIRRETREALVAIGRPAVPLLIPLLKDPDDDVRWETAKALSEIGDPRAAVELVDALTDHNFGVRWIAAEGLINIGPHSLIPLLDRLSRHSDSTWLRRGAHHVIRDVAKKNPELIHVVRDVLAALEGFEPEVGVIEPANKALERLKARTIYAMT